MKIARAILQLIVILFPLTGLCEEHSDYVASIFRQLEIRENYKKIKIGISPGEVHEILGKPDEIQDIYEPKIKNPKVIGKSFWYILERRYIGPTNAQKDKIERLVRISFDLNDKVLRVDHWGLDDR